MILNEKQAKEVREHMLRKTKAFVGLDNIEVFDSIYQDIISQYKREYGTKSFYNIKSGNLSDVHDFIDCYTPPKVLEEQINNANAQMRLYRG